MPISNQQPAGSTALNVAREQGRRRDNLNQTMIGAQQATANAQLGLLGSLMQDEQFYAQLDQHQGQFEASQALQSEQFDEKMRINQDQFEQNLAGINDRHDRQMSLAETQEQRQATQQQYEKERADLMTRFQGGQAMLGMQMKASEHRNANIARQGIASIMGDLESQSGQPSIPQTGGMMDMFQPAMQTASEMANFGLEGGGQPSQYVASGTHGMQQAGQQGVQGAGQQAPDQGLSYDMSGDEVGMGQGGGIYGVRRWLDDGDTHLLNLAQQINPFSDREHLTRSETAADQAIRGNFENVVWQDLIQHSNKMFEDGGKNLMGRLDTRLSQGSDALRYQKQEAANEWREQLKGIQSQLTEQLVATGDYTQEQAHEEAIKRTVGNEYMQETKIVNNIEFLEQQNNQLRALHSQVGGQQSFGEWLEHHGVRQTYAHRIDDMMKDIEDGNVKFGTFGDKQEFHDRLRTLHATYGTQVTGGQQEGQQQGGFSKGL